MSQSSNDTFPTAMHISRCWRLRTRSFPAIDTLSRPLSGWKRKTKASSRAAAPTSRTRPPIKFSQEISGWRSSLEKDRKMLEIALPELKELALGGTAVGTGLNAPKGFDVEVAKAVSELTGKQFVTAPNKFPRADL